MTRNHLLSKRFGGPLLAALNIFRDPLLVSLRFETPPTYFSGLISSLSLLAHENNRFSSLFAAGSPAEKSEEKQLFSQAICPVNLYIMDNEKRFLTFAGISNTSSQCMAALVTQEILNLLICFICSNRMK